MGLVFEVPLLEIKTVFFYIRFLIFLNHTKFEISHQKISYLIFLKFY